MQTLLYMTVISLLLPAALGQPAEESSGAKDTTPPHVPTSGSDKSTDDGSLMFIIQIVIAIVVGLLGIFFLFCRSTKKKFKGDAIFLVGPCDAGKTALFFRLRDGLQDGKLKPTHTSMQQNEDTFVINESKSSDDSAKPTRFIDFPGHHRVRPVLFANLEDCCGLVFVLDASNFTSKAREIAELMLDLMTSTAFLKNGRKMAVLCNKVDAMPDDFAGIEPKKMVRKRLESEIEALRSSRASGLGETDASAVRVELEISGPSFRWTDAPVEVEFLDFSAKTGEGVDKLAAWLEQ